MTKKTLTRRITGENLIRAERASRPHRGKAADDPKLMQAIEEHQAQRVIYPPLTRQPYDTKKRR